MHVASHLHILHPLFIDLPPLLATGGIKIKAASEAHLTQGEAAIDTLFDVLLLYTQEQMMKECGHAINGLLKTILSKVRH